MQHGHMLLRVLRIVRIVRPRINGIQVMVAVRNLLAVGVLLTVGLPIYGQNEGTKSARNQQNGDTAKSPSQPPLAKIRCVVEQEGTALECDYPTTNAPHYFTRLFSPENVPNLLLVIVGFGGVTAAVATLNKIAVQAYEMTLQRKAMEESLKALQAQTDHLVSTDRPFLMIEVRRVAPERTTFTP